MIEAVRQFDPEFDGRLEASWRQILREGADFIRAGYLE